MRKVILCLLFAGSIVGLEGLARADEEPKKKESLRFSLKDTKEKVHTLEQYKDKFLVLEWIEPACPYCRRHAKDQTMNTVVNKYKKNKDVVVLGICTSSHTDSKGMQSFIDKHKLQYTVLMDPTGEVGRRFGAKRTPHMFVLSKGKVVYEGAMDDDPQGGKGHDERVNYIVKAVDELIAGKKVSAPLTKPYG